MRGTRFIRVRSLFALAIAAGIALTVLSPPVQAGTATWTTVARHLDNPHGVAFTSDGKMIVTEAGHSGKTCVFG